MSCKHSNFYLADPLDQNYLDYKTNGNIFAVVHLRTEKVKTMYLLAWKLECFITDTFIT